MIYEAQGVTYHEQVNALGAQGLGTLLLLNLFRDRLNLPGEKGTKAPTAK